MDDEIAIQNLVNRIAELEAKLIEEEERTRVAVGHRVDMAKRFKAAERQRDAWKVKAERLMEQING